MNSAGLFFARSEIIISLAATRGLRLRPYFQHQEVNGDGEVVDSPFRDDYIFTV
jgi:hypothetical protein